MSVHTTVTMTFSLIIIVQACNYHKDFYYVQRFIGLVSLFWLRNRESNRHGIFQREHPFDQIEEIYFLQFGPFWKRFAILHTSGKSLSNKTHKKSRSACKLYKNKTVGPTEVGMFQPICLYATLGCILEPIKIWTLLDI